VPLVGYAGCCPVILYNAIMPSAWCEFTCKQRWRRCYAGSLVGGHSMWAKTASEPPTLNIQWHAHGKPLPAHLYSSHIRSSCSLGEVQQELNIGAVPHNIG
jgi:hypothetical protein